MTKVKEIRPGVAVVIFSRFSETQFPLLSSPLKRATACRQSQSRQVFYM